MNNLSFVFYISCFPLDLDELPVLDEILNNSEERCCDKIDTYSTWCTIDEWSHHERHKDIHGSHHLCHVRHLLSSRSSLRSLLRLIQPNESWLDVHKHCTYDSEWPVLSNKKIHTKKPMIDRITTKILWCKRSNERVDVIWIKCHTLCVCECTDNIEKSKEYWDLHEKRHTSLEWSKTVRLHDLHSFLRESLWIISILILNLFQLSLHVTHTFLHLSLIWAHLPEKSSDKKCKYYNRPSKMSSEKRKQDDK